MHAFIVKQPVDFTEFLLGKRSQNNPWRWSWATSVDHNPSSAHARSGIGSDVAVDDDESPFHASSDSRASRAANEQVSTGHFRTGIATTSIHHDDAARSHSVAHEVASHAFTDHRCSMVGGSKITPCIALEGE